MTDAPGARATPPYRYEVTHSTAELRAAHDGLEAGEETGIQVSVAGRVMLHRAQGKLAFATMRDGSGDEIQLFALAAVTEDFDAFTRINLGDWVGAEGEIVKTK
ncbi:MAG TPA: OB-fold nucleic acid binding domain-containing protein, partial [Acidimicrobiales bacterium]|nr:OB-fold nucleic acid binding domain-containing protein [Acidimicrobiales bacterium]